MSEGIVVSLPPDAVEAVAQRAAEIVLERLEVDQPSPWLSGADAIGAYLGWPRERIYKRLADLPHYRHGSRIMARRDELDRWLEALRE